MKRNSSMFSIMNWSLMWVTALLIIIGLVNLYSAVSFWGAERTSTFFWSQLVWTLIGTGIMIVLSATDYRLWQSLAWPVYVLSIIFLGLVFVFGRSVHGTYGWLRFGPISIQPAEIAKLAFIIVASRFFALRHNPFGYSLAGLIPIAIIMFIPFSLIVLAGDLGSAIFLITIFISLALFAGIKKSSLLILVIIAIVAGGGMYKYGLKEYQKGRITSFMNPESDIRGSGYHLVQSKIAVGSGRFFGKGYMQGNINKLKYLPERHTDFIFPVFAEEWGFLGGIVLMILYAVFLLMGLETAKQARDLFGTYLAFGIVSMIFWQVTINLLGVLGLMPLTGVPLPFLSYGGSSMIIMLSAVGLLFSVHRKRFTYA